MGMIVRYPINSREFRRALRPYLGSRSRHFAHEFYHFARSMYDMVGHDNASHYVPRSENDTDYDDSEDDVIEIEPGGAVVESEPLLHPTSRMIESGGVVVKFEQRLHPHLV